MAPVPDLPESLFQDVDEESLLLFKDVNPKNQKLYSDLLMLEESESSLEEEKEKSSYLSRVWAVYFEALQRRPLLVKSITAFILMGCSDLLAQGIEHMRGIGSPLDWMRVSRFAAFGLIGSPWTHYYYDWLDTVLPPTPYPWTWTTAGKKQRVQETTTHSSSRSKVSLVFGHCFSFVETDARKRFHVSCLLSFVMTAKVFIDQFIQAPILLAFIIMGMGLMQGEWIGDLQEDMQKQYMSTLIANCKC
jgi:hypothetical protein